MTVSNYCLPRMAVPPTNKMKSCGNILDLKKQFLTVIGQRKTFKFLERKRYNIEVQTQSSQKYKPKKEFLLVKIFLGKLNYILQLKSKVKSLSQEVLSTYSSTEEGLKNQEKFSGIKQEWILKITSPRGNQRGR